MSEQKLSELVGRIIMKKEQLSEESDRLKELDAPKANKNLTYEEGKQLEKKKQQQNKLIKKIENNIRTLETEIGKLENEIKNNIPTKNEAIKVTVNIGGTKYNRTVRHVANGNDSIVIQND